MKILWPFAKIHFVFDSIKQMIIAIDGPSGAGKSTLGKMLAKNLGLLYLDTGAMYRAVAYAVFESGNSAEDKGKVVEIARNSLIELSGEPEDIHIRLNGKDISPEIRNPAISQAASLVSSISEVRRILVSRQQELGKRGPGCVLDGRDIGTVVFPDADVKFFLTADPESRALRRYQEDIEKGLDASLEDTLADINRRDKRDITRADSPLSIAQDAIVVDTSKLNLDEAFAKMLSIVNDRRPDLT